jgi:hypothetical protein
MICADICIRHATWLVYFTLYSSGIISILYMMDGNLPISSLIQQFILPTNLPKIWLRHPHCWSGYCRVGDCLFGWCTTCRGGWEWLIWTLKTITSNVLVKPWQAQQVDRGFKGTLKMMKSPSHCNVLNVSHLMWVIKCIGNEWNEYQLRQAAIVCCICSCRLQWR